VGDTADEVALDPVETLSRLLGLIGRDVMVGVAVPPMGLCVAWLSGRLEAWKDSPQGGGAGFRLIPGDGARPQLIFLPDGCTSVEALNGDLMLDAGDAVLFIREA
jgi:hypothetical protein